MRSVKHGTPIHEGPGLCVTCRNAHNVRGVALNQEFTICDMLPSGKDVVRFKVTECSKYDDNRRPSLRAMQTAAWFLSTDKKSNTIGFQSPQERRAAKKADDEDIVVDPFTGDRHY